MSRVLIIGPDYFNFLSAVSDAFAGQGWETRTVPYDNPIHPYTPLMRCRYRLSRHRERLQERSRAAFAAALMAAVDVFCPDLVFIMNGDIFEPETLDALRTRARVVLWLFDSRSKVRGADDNAAHVDDLFCFEQEDVDWYRSRGLDARFLPQAFDTDVYHPLDLPKDVDILFVGNVFYSRRRRELLLAVAERYRDRKVVVWGQYHPWYKGLRGWVTRPWKSVFRNRNIASAQVNEWYNRARVVLNIHQEHQACGANPRVFEICGSGAYQVCDANPFVREAFDEGMIGLYEDRGQMYELIDDALAHPKDAEAAAARNHVLAHHSFDCRIGQMLSMIETKKM